jgi:hypothetical protein
MMDSSSNLEREKELSKIKLQELENKSRESE